MKNVSARCSSSCAGRGRAWRSPSPSWRSSTLTMKLKRPPTTGCTGPTKATGSENATEVSIGLEQIISSTSGQKKAQDMFSLLGEVGDPLRSIYAKQVHGLKELEVS